MKISAIQNRNVRHLGISDKVPEEKRPEFLQDQKIAGWRRISDSAILGASAGLFTAATMIYKKKPHKYIRSLEFGGATALITYLTELFFDTRKSIQKANSLNNAN